MRANHPVFVLAPVGPKPPSSRKYSRSRVRVCFSMNSLMGSLAWSSAVEAVIRGLDEGRNRTDETAVMIDTFRPLLLGRAGEQAEDPEYAWSWARAAR